MKLPFRLTLLLLASLLLVPAPAVAAKRYKLGERVLKQGSRGHDVRVLQDFLSKAGQSSGVDGVFGSGTKRAVKAFEAAQKRRIDGKVSPSDVAVLRDVAQNGGAVASSAGTGGALPWRQPTPEQVLRTGPGMQATVGPDGMATAPAAAPPVVRAVIAAGNQIATKPYVYGGGHGKWDDVGYDCSGSVSFALHGGGLLAASMPSGGFMRWADAGPGQWITVYAHGGHAYMVVAGLRFDTSGRTRAGTRWQAAQRSAAGYQVRHPRGF